MAESWLDSYFFILTPSFADDLKRIWSFADPPFMNLRDDEEIAEWTEDETCILLLNEEILKMSMKNWEDEDVNEEITSAIDSFDTIQRQRLQEKPL